MAIWHRRGCPGSDGVDHMTALAPHPPFLFVRLRPVQA